MAVLFSIIIIIIISFPTKIRVKFLEKYFLKLKQFFLVLFAFPRCKSLIGVSMLIYRIFLESSDFLLWRELVLNKTAKFHLRFLMTYLEKF